MQFSLHGVSPRAAGNASPWYEPHGIFPCAGEDRWIAIECHSDEERAALARLTGGDELGRWTATRDAEELAVELQAAGVRAAPCYTVGELLADEHLRARGFWFDSWHPKAGPVTLSGPMARLERTPARVRHPAPLLGEHNAEILPAEEVSRA
jgi:crotonobetainyl-CoA:carnitine CoA-transferase CaiB-like acyl-CoA transferase